MNLLLDTHALIWFAEGIEKLSPKAKFEISNTSNNKFLSIASLWEIAIKSSKNKLEIRQSFIEIHQFTALNKIQILGIGINHLSTLLTLPYYHSDPFDRLLIAQAISENLSIISADRHFAEYAANIIW